MEKFIFKLFISYKKSPLLFLHISLDSSLFKNYYEDVVSDSAVSDIANQSHVQKTRKYESLGEQTFNKWLP